MIVILLGLYILRLKNLSLKYFSLIRKLKSNALSFLNTGIKLKLYFINN